MIERGKTRRHASITAVSRPISPTHTQTSTPTRAVGDAIDAAAAEPGQALRRAPMLMKVEPDARRIPLLGVLQLISPGSLLASLLLDLLSVYGRL